MSASRFSNSLQAWKTLKEGTVRLEQANKSQYLIQKGLEMIQQTLQLFKRES